MDKCVQTLHGWAVGGGTVTFPKEAGIRMGSYKNNPLTV